jgi:ABC-type multidrug transport system ATPase subunit
MGVSGAGKSTLLDILAQKSKRRTASRRILVNGREVPNEECKGVTLAKKIPW